MPSLFFFFFPTSTNLQGLNPIFILFCFFVCMLFYFMHLFFTVQYVLLFDFSQGFFLNARYFIVIQEELLSSSCHLPLCLSSLLPLIRLGVSLSISLSSRSLWACCLFWLAASNLGKLAANPDWMLMNPGQCPPRSCRDVCFYKAQWLTS